jgi:ATP-dependent DNA ligase
MTASASFAAAMADRVRVFSRRGNDYTDGVPAIAKALATRRHGHKTKYPTGHR